MFSLTSVVLVEVVLKAWQPLAARLVGSDLPKGILATIFHIKYRTDFATQSQKRRPSADKINGKTLTLNTTETETQSTGSFSMGCDPAVLPGTWPRNICPVYFVWQVHSSSQVSGQVSETRWALIENGSFVGFLFLVFPKVPFSRLFCPLADGAESP